jgi:hypothetical protein
MPGSALARRMNSPTRHPFPFDRHDGPASNTTSPTSDPILEVEHPLSGAAAAQQRRVSAGGAVDLHKIPRPEIFVLAAYNSTIFASDVLRSFHDTITTRAVSSIRQPHLDEVP